MDDILVFERCGWLSDTSKLLLCTGSHNVVKLVHLLYNVVRNKLEPFCNQYKLMKATFLDDLRTEGQSDERWWKQQKDDGR